MNSHQMRGYVLHSAVKYLRNTVGEEEADRIVKSLRSGTQNVITTATDAAWVPTKHISEVFAAIVALSGADEDKARDSLIECGRYTASEASNTFLRLIMRLMPPALFAKKLPDFWLRDCTSGKIVAEVHEDRLCNTFTGMKGFDHIAPVAVGFVVSALTAMNKKISGSTLSGWSLKNPGPDSFSLEVRWVK